MNELTGKQSEQIVELYSKNGSILETAKECGISTVKVRKILITLGLWESDTSIKIGELLSQGMTTEEIASTLYMSVKNVQAYMPYERGLYGGEEISKEARRAGKYRSRMKQAAKMQVIKERMDSVHRKGKINMDHGSAKEAAEKKMQKVMKLHLELDTEYADEAEWEVLRKYGSVKQGISRDILVPGDITLHALHYAILRMFGWQNGHLHNYSLPEEVFQKLTENRFTTWAQMAGIYFRYPTEDYADIYWDDDYKEWESIKSWLRRKYTGPYQYKGFGEHYLMNQKEVAEMFERREEITVHEWDAKKWEPKPLYTVKLTEARVDQVVNAFADMACDELIERLPLDTVLRMKNIDKVDFKKIRKNVEEETESFDVWQAWEEYGWRNFTSLKQEREFLDAYDVSATPITEELIYRYDYGDGWKVKITCEEEYEWDENTGWLDRNKNVAAEATVIEEVAAKHRPNCIEKDGIELLDDVGGIGGFCEMLQVIYEADFRDDEQWDARNQMLDWAQMMGWTGRRVSPERTL